MQFGYSWLKALNGFYSDLPYRCIKSTQRALLSQIADMKILHHYHLRCCLYNQWGLQDLRLKDGQSTWRNPFRAFGWSVWSASATSQCQAEPMLAAISSQLSFLVLALPSHVVICNQYIKDLVMNCGTVDSIFKSTVLNHVNKSKLNRYSFRLFIPKLGRIRTDNFPNKPCYLWG